MSERVRYLRFISVSVAGLIIANAAFWLLDGSALGWFVLVVTSFVSGWLAMRWATA